MHLIRQLDQGSLHPLPAVWTEATRPVEPLPDPSAALPLVSSAEILGSISEGLIVLSPDWTFLYANAVAADILHLPIDAIVGQNHWEVCPFARGTALEVAYRKAAADRQRIELDHTLVAQGRWYRVKAHPWDRGLTICFSDITAQKQATAADQLREERFRLATSNPFLTLYEQDCDLRYTWLYPQNPDHQRALGRTDEELLPEDVAQRLTRLKREVMTSGIEVREEIETRVPSNPRHYDVFASPRRRPDGKVIGIAGAALDITDRKRMEQALRHNENRLRTTCKHAPIGIAEVDLQGALLAANPKFCTQLGYPPDTLIGRAIADLMHPAEVEAAREAYQHLVEDKVEFVSSEIRFLHQAGHLVWMSLTLSLVRDQAGSGMFGLAVVQDITDRRRADDARRRLVAIVESSEDAIVSINPDGIVQTWNRGAELLFGFPADEIIDQPITRIIPPDARQEALERLQHVTLCGETEHYDTVRIHRNGTSLHVAITVSPLCDASGAVVGISKIARDISHEKQAAMQEHLLYTLVASVNRADALEDIYEAALNALCQSQQTARSAILLFDASDVMRFAASRGLSNDYRRAVEEHSPWTASDIAPQPICIEDVATSPFSPALRRAIEAEGIRALGFIPLTYENRLIGKLMVYFDAPHQIQLEELRVAETISRQVGIAIERQRAASALEALVESRTASLQEAIQQMEEFSYSVSHDLRAPLRTMIVYADILLSDHAEKLDGEVQRYLDRILKSARRMDALVRDTLAYSKLARREITLTAVPLARLLDDVIDALDLPAGASPITCNKLSNTVWAHEPSLVQAITNLLRNALKFVAPDVIPCVEVWSELPEGRVRLWVKDNGIGIPPEWQARLFGMFERLHVDRNYEGTGIGLAMVRKAIERMGGRVGVESDGVHGSQFWIELPAATNE